MDLQLSEFENGREGLTNISQFIGRHGLDSGFEAMLCHSAYLVNDSDGRLALAAHRDCDGWMGFCRGREWHDDHSPTKSVHCVVREHDTRSCFLDFGTLCWIQTDPPNVATVDRAVGHWSIPSSNDCHSSTSRRRALSRFAARQAAARVLSRTDSSCLSRRVTRPDRWRAGTAAWNRCATASGMDNVILISPYYYL